MRLQKIGDRWHFIGEHGCPGTPTAFADSSEIAWEDRCKNCDKRSRRKGRYTKRAVPLAAHDYKPRFRFKDFNR